MFPTILIVDDQESILTSLSGILSDEGFITITATNGYEALKRIESDEPDLVLLDIWMQGMDGIDTLKEIRKNHPGIQVIMITGHGTIETAVNAIKIGAYDFIEKPLNIDRVIVAINNALNFRRLEEENRFLRKKNLEKYAITGNSAPILELKKQIGIAAPTDAWILIYGENGTGKELVARTIHQLSAVSDRPMIDINCATLSDERLEIELLGHEKNAFPGASTRRRGKFEMADGGTIFFDEIGNMGLKTQATLLRILEQKEFQRLGGSRTIPLNVRVIASTNKDLKKAIDDGEFREDLYFRLNVIPIEVPSLRERIDDLPALVDTFLARMAEESRMPIKTITPAAVEALKNYDWPGNVRELKNLIERLYIMVKGDQIGLKDIPYPYNAKRQETRPVLADLFAHQRLDKAKKAFEEEFIRMKLIEFGNDVVKTSRQTGADRKLVRKIAQSRQIA